jgi:uncharacterized SAM-binding protein YcdF (DUF218 family)
LSELSFSALMPPMCFLIIIPLAAFIAFRWRGAGLLIALISSLLLYGLCTRFISNRLLIIAESQEAPAVGTLADAQAIVVLSGDVYHGALGGVPDDVGLLTLDRLRLAATVYREHHLPILVTGGREPNTSKTLAQLMADVLQRDYGIKATWIEGKAQNTFENASYSAAILQTNKISRVVLVSEAWHLPRALWAFAQVGISATPAPAERTYVGQSVEWNDLLPDYASFSRSFYALHELLGFIYYRHHYARTSTSIETENTSSK